MRRNQGGRKDIKMLLLADNIIIYLDKPTKIRKTIEIREYNSVARDKINIQKPMAFSLTVKTN